MKVAIKLVLLVLALLGHRVQGGLNKTPEERIVAIYLADVFNVEGCPDNYPIPAGLTGSLNGNLNQGTSTGVPIYICYRKSASSKKAMTHVLLQEGDTEVDGWDPVVGAQFSPTHFDNLNHGAGGKDIYMHSSTDTSHGNALVSLRLLEEPAPSVDKRPMLGGGLNGDMNEGVIDSPPPPKIYLELTRESTRRSLLMASSISVHTHDDDYKNYVKMCGEYEYDGFLFVDSGPHIYAFASPKEDAMAVGCPFIVTHSVFEEEDKPARKEILLWKDVEEGKALFREDESLYIGTFKASDGIRALEEARTSRSGAKAYSILTNDCADFVMDFGSALGVKIDTRITSYVAQRLIEVSGEAFFDTIRETVGILPLFKSHHLRADTVTDEELAKHIVELRVSNLNS